MGAEVWSLLSSGNHTWLSEQIHQGENDGDIPIKGRLVVVLFILRGNELLKNLIVVKLDERLQSGRRDVERCDLFLTLNGRSQRRRVKREWEIVGRDNILGQRDGEMVVSVFLSK